MISDLGYIICIRAGIQGQLRHLRQQRDELRQRQHTARSVLPFDMSSEYPRDPYVRAIGHMVHRFHMARILWLPRAKTRGIGIWTMVNGYMVHLFLNNWHVGF